MRSLSFVVLGSVLVPAAVGCAAHHRADDRVVAVAGARSIAADSPLSSGEPRCPAADLACGPDPFANRPLAKTLYVAEWPRIADFPPGDPEPQNSVACGHDGECFNSGCGYACLSTRDRHTLEADCVAFPHEAARLRDHYCGCIDGFCRWFTQ